MRPAHPPAGDAVGRAALVGPTAPEAPVAQSASASAADLEAVYAALPAERQEVLWADATASLLAQGTAPAFLIRPVVQAEVERLLAAEHGAAEPAAAPIAPGAPPTRSDGCKNVAGGARASGQKVAVPFKERYLKPLRELHDPEPAHRGPPGARPPPETHARLRDVQPEDLGAVGRLLDLHRQAALRGWVSWSEAGRLHVVAAAVHARRVGQEPCRLFVALLRDRRWEVITQEDEETARVWLRDALYGPARREAPEAGAPPPVVPLSEDAHCVDLAQRVLRHGGWHREPFLAVKLQYPAWTRARWEQAQAELTQWRWQQALANTRSQLASLRDVLEAPGRWGDEEDEGDATG